MRSYMNWWIKCISAVIVKTASRNVAFKATRMRDSIMDGQDKFFMRESDNAEDPLLTTKGYTLELWGLLPYFSYTWLKQIHHWTSQKF